VTLFISLWQCGHFFVHQTEELQTMARESTQLRDELDILRHTAEKVVCMLTTVLDTQFVFKHMDVVHVSLYTVTVWWHKPKLQGRPPYKCNENSCSHGSFVRKTRSWVDGWKLTENWLNERLATECSKLVQRQSGKRGRRQWTGSTSGRLTCPTTMTVVTVLTAGFW